MPSEIIPDECLRASTKLQRRLRETDELIVCPGVYDGLSARTALDVGFESLYMTGAGTTASRLGQADLGIAQLYDMRQNAEMIANLQPGVPLIADMDCGYGGPIMTARSVTEYIRAGVAGFHLEDQVEPKRCGHLAGKQVVPLETYISRIKAAVFAREKADSDILLIARTDSLQPHGYDEAIRRLRAARDAGADVAQLEGMTSKEMYRQAIADLAPMPCLLNLVENGASPTISTFEAQRMGFRIMLLSIASLAPAYVAIRASMERLMKQGITGIPQDVTPKHIFKVCGLDESMEIDEVAGGSMGAC